MSHKLTTLWFWFWGLMFLPWFIWLICQLMVLLNYGWLGYAQGIRVVSLRPAKFSNGTSVPSDQANLAALIAFWGLLLFIFLPSMLKSRRSARKEYEAMQQEEMDEADGIDQW